MNIESIKRRLLVKYPFFGSVVANSNFVPEPSVGTAGTDGKNIYYNPNFIESITNDQQTFIFAHEICHIAFDHIFRSEGKDKELWNIATDSVVNAFLKQDGLPIVEGGVDIPDAINYDAEEMYKKLLDEKQQQQNQSNNQQSNSQSQHDNINQNSNSSSNSNNNNSDSQNQSNNSSEQNSQSNDNQQSSQNLSQNSQQSDEQNQSSNSNSGSSSTSENSSQDQTEESNDVGHDTHSMWDKAIEKKHQEERSQSNSSSSGKDKTEDEQQSLLDKLSKMYNKKKEQPPQQPQSSQREDKEKEQKKNEEIKRLTELGEKEAFEQNKIERKKQLEELRKALASQSHGHGSDTNSELRTIKDIGTSEPLIDWRRLLKEAVKYDVDWSFQNAGIEDGVVTPYLEEQPKPETEIVLDTSGSIDETLLRNFLRECKNILQTSKVKVGCFDTKFYGFTEIKDVSDIDNLPFYGGGGTNFDVAVNAFSRKVENKIIFTDGDAYMPSTPIDAIWIVFGGIKINPAGGKVIHIDDEQLERLYNYHMDENEKGKTR